MRAVRARGGGGIGDADGGRENGFVVRCVAKCAMAIACARTSVHCVVDKTHNRIKGTDRDLNGRCFTALEVKLKLSTASALTGGVSADFPRSWPCASCLASATEASARHTKMTALLITMLLLLAWCYFWVVGRSVGEGEKKRVCEDK